MENAGITPVMNVGGCGYGYGDGYGFGGGAGLWLFAILALMNGGFGWGGRDGRCATVEDLNNSANFTRLEAQVRANENTIQQGFTNLGNGICSLGYQLATDFGALSKDIAECCCGVKFDMANYAAGINANVTAQVQSVKDMLAAEKAAAQAARIQQLELQQALCGVPRILPATVYGAVPYNGYYSGCGCGNI